MYVLKRSIKSIEQLLAQDTEASVTYAALECRLAIECICYDRLRLAHDYISHDDLKKWQPKDIVNTLIKEVDVNAAETFTFSISKESQPEDSPSPTLEKLQEMEFVEVGTQIGFSPNRLGSLWNALANLALHISLPTNKDDCVTRYGNVEKIREKVAEALKEIRRINEGTFMSSGIGDEVSFKCICGTRNKRRLGLLNNGQTVNCINPKCNESHKFNESDLSFIRRVYEIRCRKCGCQHDIQKKLVEKLRTDQEIQFNCEECEESISICWKPMQVQKTLPT